MIIKTQNDLSAFCSFSEGGMQAFYVVSLAAVIFVLDQRFTRQKGSLQNHIQTYDSSIILATCS